MRISAQAKAETRQRLLAAARRLFEARGFGSTSTRDLAAAAGVASGTLFNYFPTKEALAMALVAEALERGQERFRAGRRGGESLEEELFAHVAAELRELEPTRAFLGEVLETALSPFVRAGGGPEGRSGAAELGEELRLRHLETVAELLAQHGRGAAQGFVSIHLYWTLYLGVLGFWSRDASPNQEDTLVVLDRSVRLFTASIDPGETEDLDGPENR